MCDLWQQLWTPRDRWLVLFGRLMATGMKKTTLTEGTSGKSWRPPITKPFLVLLRLGCTALRTPHQLQTWRYGLRLVRLSSQELSLV